MKGLNFVKRSLFIILSFILLVSQSNLFAASKAYAETLTNGVTVTVLDQNGKTVAKTKSVAFDKGETAFDVLLKAVGKDKINYKSYSYGPYITGINGTNEKNGYYWGLFINGVASDKGAGDYDVKNGDNILFKLIDMNTWPPASYSVKVSVIGLNKETIIPETAVDIVQGGTAYDALVQAATKHKVNIEAVVYSDPSFYTYVKNLNHSLPDNAFFNMYMNEKIMDTGLVNYQVKNGDSLKLIAETFDGSSNPGDNNTNSPSKDNDGKNQTKPSSNNTSNKEITSAIHTVNTYLTKNQVNEWDRIVALKASDNKIPNNVIDETLNNVVGKKGVFRKVTDLEKNILVLSAAGYDASNVSGINLINLLTNHDRLETQGNNGPAYALLALDSKNYQIAANAKWNRANLVDYVLNVQLDNGAWSLYGDTPSTDVTGIAMAALSPYREQTDVQAAIDKAVAWLSSNQYKTGGFSEEFNGGESSESIAQVIIGLTAVGVDPAGAQFTKSDTNLIKRLLDFQNKDGGFSHLITDNESSPISSSQAFLALTAYQNYLHNGSKATSVFQFANSQNNTVTNKDKQQSVNTKQTGSNTQIGTGTQSKTKDTNATTERTTNQKNKALPNTATNHYQLLYYGILLIVIAGGILFYQRKKLFHKKG